MSDHRFLLLSAALSIGCTQPPSTRPRSDESSVCAIADRPFSSARLLNRREYARTVEDLLGLTEEEAEQIVMDFPREPRVEGFDNNASSHIANPLLVEQLADAAQALADKTRSRGLDRLVTCTAAGRACAEQFVLQFGRRAFRRPVTDQEKLNLLTLYDGLVPEAGQSEALLAVVEAVLLSPQFLYRVESPLEPTTATSTDASSETTLVPLGPFELASRLSYFLWGSMPDDELLNRAQDGTLVDLAVLEAQATRMLSHPHAARQVRDFHTAWLGLDQLPNLMRDDAGPDAGAALLQSVLSFTDAIFWSETGSVTDLLTSDLVYTDARIGALYGGPTGTEMAPFAAPMRSGLLTQPGLLALLSHPDQSSPIRRGVFVREKFLCNPVPAPPPNVDNSPPDPDPNLTTRERFLVHTEQPACAGCHELIDPVGFTFEGYDQLGRYRETEQGLPIDTSGHLVASPDPELDGELTDALDLAAKLAGSRVVTHCLTEKWTTFALGRPAASGDACSLDFITDDVGERGGRLQEILLAIATSQMFRFREATTEEATP